MRKALLALAVVVGIATLVMIGCGGNGTRVQSQGTGLVTTTLSDPPTCKVPAGQFQHVWVTVTLVRAHISSDADSNEDGWVDLVDRTNNPVQIDLLNASATQCVLATLGSATGLRPGRYQQIRFHLLSNNPGAGEATPSPNACGSNGYNCVVLGDGSTKTLQLSSQDQTGIKVPPGQIAGGGIVLEAGQGADINIDFDACASMVRQGTGEFRLKPTLRAGAVSLNQESISGRVVDSVTTLPIAPGATIFVFAEQPDADGVDRVVMQTLADPTTGTFSLCPLPAGNYDIVVAAISDAGVAYNATATFQVSVGTAMGDVGVVPEVGVSTAPATLTGQVTTGTATATATGADIALAALQEATPSGGSPVMVTIPVFEGSTSNVPTEADTCPSETKCATYTLIVPASNPRAGTFASGGTTYTEPAAGEVIYHVNGRAFEPGGAGTPNCSPTSLTSDAQTVTAGASTNVPDLAFTGCTGGF